MGDRGRDATADIRFSIDALLKSRGVPQVDGPAAAVFWAGGAKGSWHDYVQYANGAIQMAGAPRMRDRSLTNVDEIITNAVKTLVILCDRNPDCGIVWRVHPEIGTESDGTLFWRARLAFVPVADMANCWLDRPDYVDPLDFDLSKMRVVSRYLLPSRTHDADTPGTIGDGIAGHMLPREHRFLVQQTDVPCEVCGAKYWDVAAGRLPDGCPGQAPSGDGVALTSAAHPEGAANWPTISLVACEHDSDVWQVKVPHRSGPFTLRYCGEPSEAGPWRFEPDIRESAIETKEVEGEIAVDGPYASARDLASCGPYPRISTLRMSGWYADVLVTEGEAGWLRVVGYVLGETDLLALEGATWVLESWAKDREMLIRSGPGATTDTDFETKEKIHTGYVRFSYGPNAGARRWAAPEDPGVEMRYPLSPPSNGMADAGCSFEPYRPLPKEPLARNESLTTGTVTASKEVAEAIGAMYETHDVGCACDRCNARRAAGMPTAGEHGAGSWPTAKQWPELFAQTAPKPVEREPLAREPHDRPYVMGDRWRR